METRLVLPFATPARGTVSVPGSKSINNRALLLAALAQGRSTLTGALHSDDTVICGLCLQALGLEVHHDVGASSFAVTGYGGALPPMDAKLFVGNSGTTARFVLALAALGHTPVHFDGVAAMRARPMGALLDLLAGQGATITHDGPEGFLPLTLTGAGLKGGVMSIDPSKSSQLLSAILMVAPHAARDCDIRLTGEIVSEPYIAMTLAMMADWGVSVERPTPDRILVPAGQRYRPQPAYAVEPDASSASYFFAAAAVTGGQVTVRGLSRAALQGDVGFVDALAAMGCVVDDHGQSITVRGPAQLGGLTIDMNAISDTAPTLAAVAVHAASPVTITGVEHMRWKETDRIKAMATELTAMGAKVEEHRDGLTVHPSTLKQVAVKTYDDHRMAMSLAVAGLAADGVVIEGPDCVSKTFPTFWSVLEDLRQQSLAQSLETQP